MFGRLTISSRIRIAFGAAGALVLLVAFYAHHGVGELEIAGQAVADTSTPTASNSGAVKPAALDSVAAQPAIQTLVTQARQLRRDLLVVGAGAVLLGGLFALGLSWSIFSTLMRITTALNTGAEQVEAATSEVTSNSHELADGASQQAVALEETSSVLLQIADMTHKNSDDAKTASQLSDQARTAAEKVDQTMAELDQAMSAINDSSQKINKIIKVIEEIAFQTNLLALNAAVEAARAGEHGRGFAVVADEVRNLAQRSSQAAGETNALIHESVQRAKDGAQVANQVGTALGAIVTDVGEVTSLINCIAQASVDQSEGIDQATNAVNQMDNLTQQNAANAEESAAAIEQLSEQTAQVRRIADELAAAVNGGWKPQPPAAATAKDYVSGAGIASEAVFSGPSDPPVARDTPAEPSSTPADVDLDDFLSSNGGDLDSF